MGGQKEPEDKKKRNISRAEVNCLHAEEHIAKPSRQTINNSCFFGYMLSTLATNELTQQQAVWISGHTAATANQNAGYREKDAFCPCAMFSTKLI